MKNIDAEYLYDNGQADWTFYNWFFGAKNFLGVHYGLWDNETSNLFEAQQNTNEYVKQKLELIQGDKILDAGCGVGGTMVFLAEKYGISVTGISISSGQIKRGQIFTKKHNLSHILNFQKDDYHNTSFPDNSFDKIYAIESADHANPARKFISEMQRILKPGGRLLIVDAFLSKPQDQFDVKGKKYLDNLCDAWGLPNPQTIEEWLLKMKTIGFQDIITDKLTHKVRKTSKAMYFLAILGAPFWTSLYFLGIFNKARYANLIACLSQYHLFKDNCLVYASIIATKPNA